MIPLVQSFPPQELQTSSYSLKSHQMTTTRTGDQEYICTFVPPTSFPIYTTHTYYLLHRFERNIQYNNINQEYANANQKFSAPRSPANDNSKGGGYPNPKSQILSNACTMPKYPTSHPFQPSSRNHSSSLSHRLTSLQIRKLTIAQSVHIHIIYCVPSMP